MSQVCAHRGCGCFQPMGPCSRGRRSTQPTSKTIKVVNLDGLLEEFDGPITVEQIIGSYPKHFMITPVQLMHGLVLLKLDTVLEPGRIYFLLPYSILRLNESSNDLICLAKKLTGIAKAHRSKPKPKSVPLASSPQSSQGANPCPNDFTRDLGLEKIFPSIVMSNRSDPNSIALASPRETRSSRGSNPRSSSRDLLRLLHKLRRIAKAFLSKPNPKHKPTRNKVDLAGSQERRSSQGLDPSPSEENDNMSKSTKILSWKPLLSTIREISFNRRESDLRD